MICEISVTPGGHLLLEESQSNGNIGIGDSWMKTVANAFSSHQASGLFMLGALKPSSPLMPSVSYWREFSCRFLTELCRTPEFLNNDLRSVEPLPLAQMEIMLSSIPPMRGAEYLNVEMLAHFWSELGKWVGNEVSLSGDGLSSWLKKHAPLWHQVGRVCFHLAENKRDAEFPFAFLATYAPRMSQVGQIQYQPLNKALQEYAGERNKKALINLLSPVHLASEKSNFVKDLVESNEIFHPLKWTPAEAYRLLKEIPILEESGLLVRLPDWWRKRPRPRVAVTIGEKKQSHLGIDTMLDFRADLVLGEAKLTPEEVQQIKNAQDGLLYLKGQWIEINQAQLSEALAHWSNVEKEAVAGGISFIEGMRLLAGAPADLDSDASAHDEDRQWSFINAGNWLSEILSGLRDPSRLTAKKQSTSFCGTLRSYQQTGHDWLWFLSSLGLGACLADDMGLGKTVKIISLLLSIKEAKKLPPRPSLLVLPASLLSNWKVEIQRFAPALSACFVHSSESTASDLSTIAKEPDKILSSVDLVLTTYGMLARQSWLLDLKWRLVILDEAQIIKNPSAQQTKTVKKLTSEARIALTGTPVENRLSDLWSLFDFLCPGLLGSLAKFKTFVKKLDEREHNRYAPLRNLVAPYILRRLKTDKTIISDLPDKTEMKVFCGLTKHQTVLYSRAVEELGSALKNVDGIKRRGLVLSFLLKFKQICNHPSQLLADGEYDSAHSGKFDRLRIICEEIASRQEKVLVFTQFQEMTDPIATFLSEIFGRSGLVLHGGIAVSKRKNIVDNFQQENGPPFAVLTVKAGGTGLNLTAASHVIHFDRWWNPAVENQATDRAYRIGQHRNVLVHKFICRGTIEERIDALITEKSALADNILAGGGESMLTEMSDQELLNMVSLDLERVYTEEI